MHTKNIGAPCCCKIVLIFCTLPQAFVNAQNKVTGPFLEGCEIRETFKERMTELYDYPKYSCPFKRGNR